MEETRRQAGTKQSDSGPFAEIRGMECGGDTRRDPGKRLHGRVHDLTGVFQPKRALRSEKATVRFETDPDEQLQTNWGEIVTVVGGQPEKHCAETIQIRQSAFYGTLSGSGQVVWLQPRTRSPCRASIKEEDERMVGYLTRRFPLIKVKLAIPTPQITQTKGAGRTIPQVTESVNPCVIRAIWLHNNAAPIPVIKPFWDVLPA